MKDLTNIVPSLRVTTFDVPVPLCRFGRRPTMLVACVIQAIASFICAFSVNYVMFIFLRFLVAFSVSGVFECGFVLGEFLECDDMVEKLEIAELSGPRGCLAFAFYAIRFVLRN